MKDFEHLLFNKDNSKRILLAPAFFNELSWCSELSELILSFYHSLQPPLPPSDSHRNATGGQQHPSAIPTLAEEPTTHLLPTQQSPNLLVVIPTDVGAEESTTPNTSP
jgi:hypothetical protein